jgi:hypothetical protein
MIPVSLHPDTIPMLLVLANTERDSANNHATFNERRRNYRLAARYRERANAWAETAANLAIAERSLEK